MKQGCLGTILKQISTYWSMLIIFTLSLCSYAFPSLWSMIYTNYHKESPQIVFLDIGQGDATLILFKQKVILIDAGADITTINSLDKYLPYFNREIDLLIITHPHSDHIGGLYELSKRYKIVDVLMNHSCISGVERDLLGSVKSDYSGRIFDIEHEPLQIEIKDLKVANFLAYDRVQSRNSCAQSYDGNLNNDSIITFLNYENFEILLMGDLEAKLESSVIKKLENVRESDRDSLFILKAGHHCSKTSSSESFLKSIEPDIAICSAGQGNRFKHPSKEVLERFDKLDIPYLVTFEQGDIVFELI